MEDLLEAPRDYDAENIYYEKYYLTEQQAEALRVLKSRGIDLDYTPDYSTQDKTLCLVSLTIPGTRKEHRNHPFLIELTQKLEELGISSHSVDTIPGWGNLNQDWLEFNCEVYTSWGWCVLVPLIGIPYPGASWDWATEFHKQLHDGSILMHLSYIRETETGKDYIPHS